MFDGKSSRQELILIGMIYGHFASDTGDTKTIHSVYSSGSELKTDWRTILAQLENILF